MTAHGFLLVVHQVDLALASTANLDADGSVRHSLGMLKSIRSLHVDPQHHSRTISRDFSLPPIPVSSLLHENCSSLKDQFLKIKERFSAPSPTATSKPSSKVADLQGASQPGEPSSTPSISATLDVELEQEEKKAVKAGESRSETTAEKVSSSAISAVDKDLKHSEQLPGETIKQDATRLYSGEVKWSQHQTQMERWYVEDNFFKGSITCWTMDKGAEIVGRIAAVVSSSPESSLLRINPDISLQWIGRQLWAITVSLPLTRSGELKDEHLGLARRINDAIATEESRLSATASITHDSHVVRRSSQLPSSSSCREEDQGEGDNQVPTVVLRDPDLPRDHLGATLRVEEDVCRQLAAEVSTELSDVNSPVAVAPGSSPPVEQQVSATPAKHSNCSVSTLAAEEEYAQDDDDAQSAGSQPIHEEADVVASLPLSWSMLSTTSLPESVGISFNGSDPRDDDTRCAPEKTGWLKKKTGLNSWQQRYFELKGNRLYYFASETDGVPRGAIVLDHAHVLRGKGDQSMTFSITTSSSSHSLQIMKFSARMTPQVHLRKCCVLRVIYESEESVATWVTALNRASFYCNLSVASGSASSSFSQSHSFSSPGKSKKKVPFYRLRATSSSASSADDENKSNGSTGSTGGSSNSGSLGSVGTLECSSYHHYGSVKYLQETDPLLWEIHPHDQLAIRKKATLARTKSDYLTILSKYSTTFRQIFLPRPQPISLEQTLRDILPELFLINNILYGGGDENNGLENIFEVLDSYIKRFASAQEERVRAVSTLLQACARTISGGDSYFVIHSLLGNPFMIIRPAEARGHPIEIEVSPTNPCQFLITVFSAFSFHHIDDVEKYGDTCDGTAMTPEPLLRVKTYHIQEFDFGSGKSSRWLQIRADGMKDEERDAQYRHTWVKREGSETGFGALLDALS